MKILFVAMANSVHTARWINQIPRSSNEVYIYPCINTGSSHPDLHDLTIYHNFYSKTENVGKNVTLLGYQIFDTSIEENLFFHYSKSIFNLFIYSIEKVTNILWPNRSAEKLAKIIQKINPDVIHSMQIQASGYLTLEAKKIVKSNFPRWIVTNWGSDISLFGSDPSHASKIREVLSECDYYSCECERDLKLARKFGFKGKFLEVMPNAGGYDIPRYKKYSLVSPSQRKYIMVKGYQGWAGRSLVALEALDSIGYILHEKKYGLIIYSMAGNTEVEKRAEAIAQKHHLKLKLIPQFTPHDEIIRLHAESRISIGLSMGDGISTSLLESMLTGSFPIQSYTACADEWIVDGHTGILVPPEAQQSVKRALLKAIEDDGLVDKAAKLNLRTIKQSADYNKIRKQVLELYNTVIKESKKS